jgi:hypothetical protein
MYKNIRSPANPTIGKNHMMTAFLNSSEFLLMNFFLSKVAVSIRQIRKLIKNTDNSMINRGQP